MDRPEQHRIGVPPKATARRTETLTSRSPTKELTETSLARFFLRLKTGAVDNFTQLGFSQLLVVVLDYGLALLGAHLCIFNALGSLEGFGNRCRAFRTLHSLNPNSDGLGESCSCNNAKRQNQN